MKKTLLFLAAALMSAVMMAQSPKVTLDFTTNNWGLPEGSNAGLTTEAAYSNGTYSVTLAATTKYYFNTDGGYLMLGKEGSSLKLPAFDFAVSKIAITGTSGASTAVKQNIYVGDNAVSTETTGMKNVTQEYAIDAENQAAGNIYTLKITSAHNTQITKIEIYEAGGTPTPATLDSLVIKGKAEKMEYEVGEAFDPAGLEVWGYYTKTVKHDSTSQITSGITWTIDPETFAEISDNASVTLSASYKDLTTADTTITGIKVSEPAPLPKYATIYTSNVELTTTGGTSASAAKVVVAEGDTVAALKAGTGSAAGSVVVSIPATTKTLHFHVVGWKGATVQLDINGEKLDITSEDGITSNSPFTLKGDAYDYYYAIDPQGATSITFTAATGNRFVLFGVNAELEEGTVASPTFTPSATDFEGSVEVSLACETEGAEIFYALNEEVTSMNAIKYTEPIKLIETTTIYAIAKKDGKESAQASKTYTLIPVFESLEALVTVLPATDTKVKVKVTLTDVVIDSFYVSKSYTNGVYVTVKGAALELYKYDVPATWEVGGTISGTIIADWNLYKGVPELQNFDSWDAFTYNAPVPVVPTTFNVTVPEGTDACYLVGSLNNWNEKEPIAMTKVDDTHYTYTAESDLTGAEYKYVHGADWKYVEKNADGSEMGNRVVNDVVMNDVVAMWADQTALNNINANKKAAKQIVNGQIVIVRDGKAYNVLGF